MSDPIIVNQSTSVVHVDTSTVVYPRNAVVLLSTITSPGTIVTIRDVTGYSSTNRGISVSTMAGVHFLDGPGCNVYNINQPYGFLTVTPRTSNVWAVLNTFAFPDQAATPSVVGIYAQFGNFSNIYGDTGTINNLTVNYSSILNVSIVSSMLAKSISTRTLAVSDTLSAVNISTSSGFFSSVNINNSLLPSTSLDVNGSMRASTLFITKDAYIQGSLVYNTNNIVSTVRGLGTSSYISSPSLTSTIRGLGTASYISSASLVSSIQGLGTASYISSASLVSSIQGLGTASYVSSASLVSTVQGLGSSKYVSSLDLVSTVQGLGSSKYVSSLDLMSTVQGLGNSSYVSSASLTSSLQGLGVNLTSTVVGLGSSKYVSSLDLMSTVQGLGNSSYISSASLTSSLQSVGSNMTSTVAGLGSSKYVSSLDLMSTVQGLGNSSYVSTASLISTVQGLGTSRYISAPNILVSSISTFNFVVYGTSTFINSSNIYIGNSYSTNTLRFIGTSNDGYGDSNSYGTTVLSERIWSTNITGTSNASELLLFKGSHDSNSAPGPDRVRVLTTGSFQVDIASNGGSWPINGNPPNTIIQALTINSSGKVGIGCNSPAYTLDIAGTINASAVTSGGSPYTTIGDVSSTIKGLGSSGYLSTPYINISSISTQSLVVFGQSTIIGSCNIFIGDNTSTNIIRFIGTRDDRWVINQPIIPFVNTAIAERLYYTNEYQAGSSELLLFKGKNSALINGAGIDRVRVLTSGGFKVDIASNGGVWPIGGNPPSTSIEALSIGSNGWMGLNCNVASYTLDVNGNINASSNIYANGIVLINSDKLVSTVAGLGSSSYVSSTHLVSTVRGLGSSAYVSSLDLVSTVTGLASSSYVSSSQLASTVQGLGSSSYVSSTQLVSTVQGLGSSSYVSSTQLVSTVQGLGSSSYVSSTQLVSTVQGLGSSSYVSSTQLVSTVEGLGTSSYISSTQLVSTVQGLGSSSYVSSTQLVSTVQGLGSSLYVSSTQLVSTVQGLGTSGYLSSPHITVTSVSTQQLVVYGSNVLLGNNPTTNTIRFIGSDRDAWDGTSLITPYVNTVISERLYDNLAIGSSELLLFKGKNATTAPGSGLDRVRVLSPGGFKVDIGTNSATWPIGGNPPDTIVEALTVISNGYVGISCNAPSYTLDVYGDLNVRSNIYIDGNFLPTTNNTISTVQGLGSSLYVSSTQLVSTVQGLGSSSYVSSTQLVSTVQGLASSSYVSSTQLVSTVEGLGTSSYISSTQLVSTVQGLASSSYVSSTQLVSTVEGLGTSSYISSTQLVSTVQGLGTSGYLSSPHITVTSVSTQQLVVYGSNVLLGNNPTTNTIRFIGSDRDAWDGTSLITPYVNTVISERLYDNLGVGSSELLLFKGNDATTVAGSGLDRVRVLSAGGFKVDIGTNSATWPIDGNPPVTVVEALTVISNGYVGISCNAPTYTLDVYGDLNVRSNAYINGEPLITRTNVVSTIQGLGTAGYMSSPVVGLTSTVAGLGNSSYISSSQLVSTIQGLGTAGYMSSPVVGLTSTVAGLGTSSYISSSHVVSTIQGLGSSSYISSSHVVSTIQGLGSSSYISSSQLVSSIQGLGNSSYISSLHIVSTVQGLGSSGYISSFDGTVPTNNLIIGNGGANGYLRIKTDINKSLIGSYLNTTTNLSQDIYFTDYTGNPLARIDTGSNIYAYNNLQARNSILTSNFTSESITANTIAVDTLTAGNIVVSGITSNFTSESITANTIAVDTLTAGNIIGGYDLTIYRHITATTGNITATAGNVYGVDVIATSDLRLKTNIVTIDSPLEKISAMRGVYFNKISDSTIRKVGVIAQEIETVLPEVVFTDDTEEKMKGVSYGNITSILIEGMKAQQSSIQSLVTTISSLQSQIVLLQRPTP